MAAPAGAFAPHAERDQRGPGARVQPAEKGAWQERPPDRRCPHPGSVSTGAAEPAGRLSVSLAAADPRPEISGTSRIWMITERD